MEEHNFSCLLYLCVHVHVCGGGVGGGGALFCSFTSLGEHAAIWLQHLIKGAQPSVVGKFNNNVNCSA